MDPSAFQEEGCQEQKLAATVKQLIASIANFVEDVSSKTQKESKVPLPGIMIWHAVGKSTDCRVIVHSLIANKTLQLHGQWVQPQVLVTKEAPCFRQDPWLCCAHQLCFAIEWCSQFQCFD